MAVVCGCTVPVLSTGNCGTYVVRIVVVVPGIW
jgi:hypothetical protein